MKKLKIDEEDELALEKKKNLEILKNLLHINVEHPKPNKQAASARKFKYEVFFNIQSRIH